MQDFFWSNLNSAEPKRHLIYPSQRSCVLVLHHRSLCSHSVPFLCCTLAIRTTNRINKRIPNSRNKIATILHVFCVNYLTTTYLRVPSLWLEKSEPLLFRDGQKMVLISNLVAAWRSQNASLVFDNACQVESLLKRWLDKVFICNASAESLVVCGVIARGPWKWNQSEKLTWQWDLLHLHYSEVCE